MFDRKSESICHRTFLFYNQYKFIYNDLPKITKVKLICYIFSRITTNNIINYVYFVIVNNYSVAF